MKEMYLDMFLLSVGRNAFSSNMSLKYVSFAIGTPARKKTKQHERDTLVAAQAKSHLACVFPQCAFSVRRQYLALLLLLPPSLSCSLHTCLFNPMWFESAHLQPKHFSARQAKQLTTRNSEWLVHKTLYALVRVHSLRIRRGGSVASTLPGWRKIYSHGPFSCDLRQSRCF